MARPVVFPRAAHVTRGRRRVSSLPTAPTDRRAGRAGHAGRVNCTQRVYAHRSRKHLIISEFDCVNTDTEPSFVSFRQDALTLGTPVATRASVQSGMPGVVCSRITAAVAEAPGGNHTVVGECHDVNPIGIPQLLKPGEPMRLWFISARCASVDPGLPSADAAQDPVDRAKQEYAAARANATALFGWHAEAIGQLQRPGVSVSGNLELARSINASMAALMSAVRDDSPFSTSPEGLLGGRYGGHTFWDVETWQLPTWNMFFPAVARAVLQYRVDRARAAAANAAMVYNLYGRNYSFRGLKFPWESAFAGLEQAPGNTEDHVQGDIALAFLRHWWSTADATWLGRDGYPIIAGLAEFYASRATRNLDGTYSIARTMGPDEYHGNVTDSVFGNSVAAMTLRAAAELAAAAGAARNSTYAEIAAGLRILYDDKLDYHPEFAGYRIGALNSSAKIKQADVVLLGYPLGVPVAAHTRRRDLNVYANATDPAGPAMTWSMHAINFLDLGDDTRAAANFARGHQDSQTGPFLLWHEQAAKDLSPSQGAPNFITGAGGFMQSVWAGYGGVRLDNASLALRRPRPPPGCTGLQLRRLHYRGAYLNLEAFSTGWSLALDGSSSAVAVELTPCGAHGPSCSLGTTPVSFASGTSAAVRALAL